MYKLTLHQRYVEYLRRISPSQHILSIINIRIEQQKGQGPPQIIILPHNPRGCLNIGRLLPLPCSFIIPTVAPFPEPKDCIGSPLPIPGGMFLTGSTAVDFMDRGFNNSEVLNRCRRVTLGAGEAWAELIDIDDFALFTTTLVGP